MKPGPPLIKTESDQQKNVKQIFHCFGFDPESYQMINSIRFALWKCTKGSRKINLSDFTQLFMHWICWMAAALTLITCFEIRWRKFADFMFMILSDVGLWMLMTLFDLFSTIISIYVLLLICGLTKIRAKQPKSARTHTQIIQSK